MERDTNNTTTVSPENKSNKLRRSSKEAREARKHIHYALQLREQNQDAPHKKLIIPTRYMKKATALSIHLSALALGLTRHIQQNSAARCVLLGLTLAALWRISADGLYRRGSRKNSVTVHGASRLSSSSMSFPSWIRFSRLVMVLECCQLDLRRSPADDSTRNFRVETKTGVCIEKGVTILLMLSRPLKLFHLLDGIMTTAHRPTWAAAQAAASDVGNWSTGGERNNC